ncbi:MAG: glycoside hydrolase family 97 protein [Prolixibacteraceae bacterium]|nr:glycoside hydrolase family 97 protein [Prolixibacteraceae bacterium]
MKISGVLFILVLFVSLAQAQSTFEIKSPDKKINFALQNKMGAEDGLFYSIRYGNQSVVEWSKLGITCNGDNWNKQLMINPGAVQLHDTTWTPVYGERNQIRDQYNESVITITRENRKFPALQLIVRAYNSGIAFRYKFATNENGGPYLHLTNESTEFNFQENTKAWFTARAQSLHQLLPLKNWPDESDRPLTLELPNGLFACLAEAEMVNYSRTKFKLNPEKENSIQTSIYGDVDEIAPFASPWRVVMVAEKAGDLLANNDLILNLNPPCAIADPSWIKPGQVMREVTLSTSGAKKLVDFAVARNIKYIHFDAGWYGFENDYLADATTVTVDPRRNPKGDLDLQEAIRYAKSKGIGVFLYVNQRALAAQLDTILPLYQKWGVAGIKFGFVQVGSHRWTTWLHEAVKKCAKYHLLVDIHDEYRPTGFSRTYPNLMTQEGIRGNEEMPDAVNNTILPFTRFVAGAADYTFCYFYRKELGHATRHIQNTPAHQLALPVIYYSPLQWMYWYDKPEDYQNEPELAFWDVLPTTWDDTKIINGEIGKYITIARQNQENWFVGCITNTEARELKVPLDFLESGKKYEATLYFDDPNVATRTHVGISKQKVDSKTILNINLQTSGGQAILIKPVK